MPYKCPVCYYPDLIKAPQDYSICPCCGTEFDYDDASASHLELCWRWFNSGARWHSRVILPPPNWDAVAQLLGVFDGRTTLSNDDSNESGLPAALLINERYGAIALSFVGVGVN